MKMSPRNGDDSETTRPVDSLLTESPPFLRDIIFISRKHRRLDIPYLLHTLHHCTIVLQWDSFNIAKSEVFH